MQVPTSLLAAFNASELERLFVGQSSVDVNELRAFAHFQVCVGLRLDEVLLFTCMVYI